MTVLARPRHPVVADALDLARRWCAGHVIDGSPALVHAVRVALTLDRHVPTAPPELVAAVLLHDAPEFAPPDIDLDATLAARVGDPVVRVVRAIEEEHRAVAGQLLPAIRTDDPWTLLASTADKIVSFTSILRRAAAADPEAYWRIRQPFLHRLPYFHAFHHAAACHLPLTMAEDLQRLIARADRLSTGNCRPPDATVAPTPTAWLEGLVRR
jgi:hypothetical protein